MPHRGIDPAQHAEGRAHNRHRGVGVGVAEPQPVDTRRFRLGVDAHQRRRAAACARVSEHGLALATHTRHPQPAAQLEDDEAGAAAPTAWYG